MTTVVRVSRKDLSLSLSLAPFAAVTNATEGADTHAPILRSPLETDRGELAFIAGA